MFHCATSPEGGGGGGGGVTSVRDRLSARKLSPITAFAWRIRNPTESPPVLTVRIAVGSVCQAPLPVTHPLTVCTSDPPGVYSWSIRHSGRPLMPSTSPLPC